MKSRATQKFWACFEKLPANVQDRARGAYRLFRENHLHPSLQFKQVHPAKPIYSVRITRDYRAVGVMSDSTMVWFWIGSHAEYDRLLSRR